jgi:hypothetical protein
MSDSTTTVSKQVSPADSRRGNGAREVAGEAEEQARHVAEAASEKSREVAAVAVEKGRDVVEATKTQVAQVGEEAVGQARDLVSDAKEQLRGQARVQTDQIAEGLRRLEQQAKALLEGRSDEAGSVKDWLGEATDQLGRFAARTQERGFDGLVQDLRNFSRNRPGPFLAGATAAGFAVARLWRSGAVSQAAEGSSDQGREPNGAARGSGDASSWSGDASFRAGG